MLIPVNISHTEKLQMFVQQTKIQLQIFFLKFFVQKFIHATRATNFHPQNFGWSYASAMFPA